MGGPASQLGGRQYFVQVDPATPHLVDAVLALGPHAGGQGALAQLAAAHLELAADGAPYRRSDYVFGADDRLVFAIAVVGDHVGTSIGEAGMSRCDMNRLLLRCKVGQHGHQPTIVVAVARDPLAFVPSFFKVAVPLAQVVQDDGLVPRGSLRLNRCDVLHTQAWGCWKSISLLALDRRWLEVSLCNFVDTSGLELACTYVV